MSEAWVICFELMPDAEQNRAINEIKDDIELIEDQLDSTGGFWDGNRWIIRGMTFTGMLACGTGIGCLVGAGVAGMGSTLIDESGKKAEIQRLELDLRRLQRELDRLEGPRDEASREWHACLSHYDGKSFFGF